jgi:hypothetical protein
MSGSKDGGITPTIVNGRSFIVITRPMAAGSAPNRRRQRLSLKMTDCQPAGVSSAAVKSRPIDGLTPSIRKKFQDTRIPLTRSGSPLAISVGLHERMSAISSNVWLRSRQSRNVR